MIKCHKGEVLMQTCGKKLLDSMFSLAKTLDQAEGDLRYQKTLSEQQAKIHSPELIPSAQVLSTMKKESATWLNFAGELSKKHKTSLTQNIKENSTDFIESVERSFNEAGKIKQSDTVSFEKFMRDFKSE